MASAPAVSGYRTRDEARADVFDYIERFYNPRRRHSKLGYLSLVGNVVGAGIKPQSTHPDRAVRERLQVLCCRQGTHRCAGPELRCAACPEGGHPR